MKRSFIIGFLFIVCLNGAYPNDAPVTTAGTVLSTTNTAVLPITATNFTSILSCGLEIHYDPAVATATGVTTGPGLGSGLNSNLTVPGVIILGWYTFPAITLPGNPVIFNITFTKVTTGTSAITWYDDGYSCYYSDASYNILNDVPQSAFYFEGSLTFAPPLIANFSVSNTTPAKNTTVQFTDLSSGSPTNWTWSFNRTSVSYVGGTHANSQHPQVQFTESGLYTVTLIASNPGGSDTEVKTDYIRAGIPGLWTGVTSSDWLTSTNWDNWLVPAGANDVLIPAAAAYWPVFTGDLTIGTTCESITLNGSSRITITGNFTIGNGFSLSVHENGVLMIGGNWTNAGDFNAGEGTVEFIGSSPAQLIGAGSPPMLNQFHHLFISKNGASLTVPSGMVVEVNGDLSLNPQ